MLSYSLLLAGSLAAGLISSLSAWWMVRLAWHRSATRADREVCARLRSYANVLEGRAHAAAGRGDVPTYCDLIESARGLRRIAEGTL